MVERGATLEVYGGHRMLSHLKILVGKNIGKGIDKEKRFRSGHKLKCFSKFSAIFFLSTSLVLSSAWAGKKGKKENQWQSLLSAAVEISNCEKALKKSSASFNEHIDTDDARRHWLPSVKTDLRATIKILDTKKIEFPDERSVILVVARVLESHKVDPFYEHPELKTIPTFQQDQIITLALEPLFNHWTSAKLIRQNAGVIIPNVAIKVMRIPYLYMLSPKRRAAFDRDSGEFQSLQEGSGVDLYSVDPMTF